MNIKVDAKTNEIIDKIKNINPLEITPIEALNELYELKEEIKKDK